MRARPAPLAAGLALATGLTLALTSPALAERGELELSVGPQLFVAQSTSVHPLTDDNDHLTTSLRASYAVTDLLDVHVGYRWTGTLRRTTDDGVATRADLHGVTLGARARVPLLGRWLRAYAQLELEASVAELTLDAGSLRGQQASWSGGAIPEVGLEARTSLGDDVAAVFRLGVAYALRLDHHFDAMALDLDAPTVRPLDLGHANLSGLIFGFTLGVRF